MTYDRPPQAPAANLRAVVRPADSGPLLSSTRRELPRVIQTAAQERLDLFRSALLSTDNVPLREIYQI